MWRQARRNTVPTSYPISTLFDKTSSTSLIPDVPITWNRERLAGDTPASSKLIASEGRENGQS
jgi:hypothetical protein